MLASAMVCPQEAWAMMPDVPLTSSTWRLNCDSPLTSLPRLKMQVFLVAVADSSAAVWRQFLVNTCPSAGGQIPDNRSPGIGLQQRAKLTTPLRWPADRRGISGYRQSTASLALMVSVSSFPSIGIAPAADGPHYIGPCDCPRPIYASRIFHQLSSNNRIPGAPCLDILCGTSARWYQSWQGPCRAAGVTPAQWVDARWCLE